MLLIYDILINYKNSLKNSLKNFLKKKIFKIKSYLLKKSKKILLIQCH